MGHTANREKKGILLPVVIDNKYARSDDECTVESLEVSDYAIRESVRANRSGGYHAAPILVETSRIADSAFFAAGDAVSLTLSCLIAGIVTHGFAFTTDLLNQMLPVLPLWLLVAAGLNFYPGWGQSSVDELRNASNISTISFLTLAFFAGIGVGPGALVLAWFVSIPLVVLSRNRIAKHLITSGRGGQSTVIYGASASGRQVLKSIRDDFRSGLIPIAFLDDDPGLWGQKIDGLPVLGDTNLVIPEASAAIVALPRFSKDSLIDLLSGPLSYYQRLLSIPEWDTLRAINVQPFDQGRFFGLNIAKSPVHPDKCPSKRILDLTVTLGTAPIWFPVMCAIWIVILIDTREAPLERYPLKTRGCPSIWVYRFVSPPSFHTLLRRTGLEHLPALMNVVSGSLSLVGPRAWILAEAHSAQSDTKDETRVRAGLTGLSLVAADSSGSADGFKGTERFYIQHWSIWLDLIVLGRAVSCIGKLDSGRE